MKHLTKLIGFICCAILLSSGNLIAQVAPAKIKTKVTLPKDRISPKKLNKWNVQFQKIEFKGEYVLFESDLYKAYRQGIKSNVKNKKTLKATGNTKKVALRSSGEMNQISNASGNMQETSINSDYILNGNDCGNQITPDLCEKVKNAMRIEMIEDEEVPRDCPDEHCFPISIHKKLKYIILSKNIKEFNATFYDTKGNKVGVSGNPVSISSDGNYIAYPIKLEKILDDMVVNVLTYSSNSKNVYKATIKMKDF